MLDDAAERLPVGRIGQPEDFSHAVIFLMTNSFMTGTVINVNAGNLLS